MTTEASKNYNWGEYDFSQEDIEVLDTSLRDGLQDSAIRHPHLSEKEELLRRLVASGISAVDIAIPIAGGTHLKDAIILARQLPKSVDVVCLTRTHKDDVKAALQLSQGAGRQIEAIIFCGASPLRRWVEEWRVEQISEWMSESVGLASREGIIPTIATEHTTETEPEVLKQIFRAGLENGGKKVCIADTTGVATPRSIRRLIKFFQGEIIPGFNNIEIDYHGHNDRNLAVINSLEALDMGAKRVHSTAIGIGERAGNTAYGKLKINLKLAGDIKSQDLSKLPAYEEFASRIFKVPIPSNYPGIGEKVSMTAAGIHAAAMRKARLLGLEAGAPYSSVDPRWFGRESSVRIGPLSGSANVLEVAERLGIKATDELIRLALEAAKTLNKILSDDDLKAIANSLNRNGKTNGNS